MGAMNILLDKRQKYSKYFLSLWNRGLFPGEFMFPLGIRRHCLPPAAHLTPGTSPEKMGKTKKNKQPTQRKRGGE